MSGKIKPSFVKAPPHLQTRMLIQTAEALSIDDAVKKAEEKIAEIVESHTDWANEDIKKLMDSCAMAESDEANREAHMADLYFSAHNLKGMGGNFGYPIVTDIMTLFCNYIGEHPQPDLRVVSLHVDAVRAVFDHKLVGDGGSEGRLLVERLIKLGGKVMADVEGR